MPVRDLMAEHPSTVQQNDTVQHAAQEMKRHNVGFLPVCQGETLLGVITDRDIVVECVATGNDPNHCFVREYMTANPICIGPDASSEDALRLMGEEQIRRLCVVAGDPARDGHRLVGVIALGDLAVRAKGEGPVGKALAEISQPVRSQAPTS